MYIEVRWKWCLLSRGTYQSVHTETIFELVWLNGLTETGGSTSIHSACHSVPRQWTHFLVMWAEMMLLHHAKNRFVLAFIHAAAVVAELFLSELGLH